MTILQIVLVNDNRLNAKLEKVYDKLEWSFIRDSLIKANLPTDLIELIMSCISMVSTSLLFNGEALDPKGNKTRGPLISLFIHFLYGFSWPSH